MSSIIQEIISALFSGLTTAAQGLGQGLNAMVTQIFLTGEGTTASPYALSTFGAVVVTFAAVSLAVGLGRWVVNLITSFGNRNS